MLPGAQDVPVSMTVANYDASDVEDMRTFLRWVSALLTVPVVFYSAQTFFVAAWRELRQGRLGMDVPVALAVILAFVASLWATVTHGPDVYYDSVTMFAFFLLTGRYLEMGARHGAGQAAEALVRLLPATATRHTILIAYTSKREHGLTRSSTWIYPRWF